MVNDGAATWGFLHPVRMLPVNASGIGVHVIVARGLMQHSVSVDDIDNTCGGIQRRLSGR